MELFDAYLEELMLSKAFEDLNPAERACVLERITEAAFINYQFVLKATAEGYRVEEKELVPDPDIPAKLREHFDAKFQPLKLPQVFQPANIYRSVAILGLVAIIIGFFMINGTGEIHVQKPRRSIVQAVPVETASGETASVEINQIERAPIKENAKPVKVRRPVPAPVNVKLKSPVAVVPVIKIEKDSATTETPELLGMNVHEPLLCLDVDINQQVPGLYDGINTVEVVRL